MVSRSLAVSVAAAAFLFAGCGTTMQVRANVGTDANPSRNGVAAPLDVYVFLLRSDAAFVDPDKRVEDFLTDELRKAPGVDTCPAFLKETVLGVHVLTFSPAAKAEDPPVEKAVELPEGTRFVGVVAAFQDHRDGDRDWRLCVDAAGGVCAFHVRGRRLEAGEGDAPKK
jgi:type VI secretion system VasD/TssJ family lipoprotein